MYVIVVAIGLSPSRKGSACKKNYNNTSYTRKNGE
jgi:hypothetical protein